EALGHRLLHRLGPGVDRSGREKHAGALALRLLARLLGVAAHAAELGEQGLLEILEAGSVLRRARPARKRTDRFARERSERAVSIEIRLVERDQHRLHDDERVGGHGPRAWPHTRALEQALRDP